MACPNCQHTMQNLGVEGKHTFWCPRCGTIKTEVREVVAGQTTNVIDWEEHEVPRWQKDMKGLKDRLDKTANSLVSVAGALMQRACGDDYEHTEKCNCYTCRAFLATQAAITALSNIVRELS